MQYFAFTSPQQKKKMMIESSAEFSDDRVYRYTLWRIWERTDYVMFIGLNPSTADETKDDPTIRRCIGFAEDWGFGGLCMVNIFAYRATLPEDMKKAKDPIGPKNDYHITLCGMRSGLNVAAWGVHGIHNGREKEIPALLPSLCHLGLTKGGHPRHPLYLSKTTKPIPWS